MPDNGDAVTDYLERLAESLEALGPAETSEVLAEVHSHLTEAIQDTSGDQREALARFGSPEDLALSILEERGILSDGSPVPEASAKLRIAALAIDVSAWLVACMLLVRVIGVIVFVGISRFTDGSGFSINVIAVLLMLVAAAALGWLWFGRRRRKWFTSTGMEVMGLRTIRVGRTTRIVRARGIPGAARGKWSRAGSLASTTIVLLILVFGLVSFIASAAGNRASDREAAASNAVTYSATGVAMVSEIYREVQLGEQTELLSGGFASGSNGALTDLLARRRQGKIASYAIGSVDLTGAELGEFAKTSVPGDAGVFVSVTAYPEGSGDSATYRYLVKLIWTSKTANGASGEWLIQSVELVS
jgi:uncharacterized membrane protein